MTCTHMVVGDSFVNISGRKYNVITAFWTATRRMLIYLISCTKCGVQYAGKTSQSVCSRIIVNFPFMSTIWTSIVASQNGTYL